MAPPIVVESGGMLSKTFIFHFRPRQVPAATLKFTHTWGLGGMAAVLVVLQVLTGVLLKTIYEPSPGKAYESILTIQNDVLFGQLIRNIHHWTANILVIIVLFHMLRVFFTGAFHKRRRLNWVFGLVLFFLVLAANFTGYLLPWDQLSFWAVTISTGMLEYVPGVGLWLQKMIRGGPDVGLEALLTFFNFHTAIVPFCLLALMGFHFWRVRKAGNVVIPRAPADGAAPPGSVGEVVPSATDSGTTPRRNYVPTIPNLIVREIVVASVLIAFILVFSVMFNAPLGDKANPGLSPNPTKAPWYFVGTQELLLHFHPLFAVLVIPLILAAALFLLPYLRYQSEMPGVWFRSFKGRRMAAVATAIAVVVTPLAILAGEFLIDTSSWMGAVPATLSNGLVPVGLVVAAVAGFYVLMKRRYAASKNETVQAVFVLLLVVFAILTVTGVWFRGEGMALAWPWEVVGL